MPDREQFICLLSSERGEQMGNHYRKIKQVTADQRRLNLPENLDDPLPLYAVVDAKRDFSLPLLLPNAFF
jgi:hypothetical protein